jgi:Predicted metalloendopeptidase
MGFDIGGLVGFALGGPIGGMIGSEIGHALENQGNGGCGNGNGGCGDAAQDFANARHEFHEANHEFREAGHEFREAAHDRSEAQYHRGRAADDFSHGNLFGGLHELSEARSYDNAARHHEAEGRHDLAEGRRDQAEGYRDEAEGFRDLGGREYYWQSKHRCHDAEILIFDRAWERGNELPIAAPDQGRIFRWKRQQHGPQASVQGEFFLKSCNS